MDYVSIVGWASGIILYIFTWKLSRFFISRRDYEDKSPADIFLKRFFTSLFISIIIIPLGAGLAVALVNPKNTDTNPKNKEKISLKTERKSPSTAQPPPTISPQVDQAVEKITTANPEPNKTSADHPSEPASSPE